MIQPIKSRYTLDECYTVLDIHPKTFRAWLKEGGITPEHSRADRRIKFLTAAQVERLARLHDKPWPPTASTQEPVIRPEAYKLLLEQLAEADQQAQQISTEHAQLQAAITELRDQAEATTRQLAAIEQTAREQAENNTKAQAEELDRWQKTRAVLDILTTHYQELATASQEQRQQLKAMQASQQEAAACLDTLAAESSKHAEQLTQLTAEMDKQGQRYAQLAGRVDKLQRQGEQAQKDMQESLEQMQAHTQEQAQEAEKRLQAQFQAALTTLRQQMLEELERRAQGIETEQARDVAALTAQQEQLIRQIEHATTKAEAATTTALHRLTSLETGREQEQAVRASLAERVTRLEAQAAQVQQPQQGAVEQPEPAPKKSGRRPKQAECP